MPYSYLVARQNGTYALVEYQAFGRPLIQATEDDPIATNYNGVFPSGRRQSIIMGCGVDIV